MEKKEQKMTETQGTQVEIPATTGEATVQMQPPVNPQPVVTQPAPAQQKPGVKAWLKQHWKGVVGTVVAVGAAAAGTAKAYSLGKQNGMNMQPPTGGYDPEYGLNPNVDE